MKVTRDPETDKLIVKIKKAQDSPVGRIVRSADKLLGGAFSKGTDAVDTGTQHAQEAMDKMKSNFVKKVLPAAVNKYLDGFQTVFMGRKKDA